jgi:hypothetical protein
MVVSAISVSKEFLRFQRLKSGFILFITGLFFCACVPPQKFTSERWLSSGSKVRGAMVQNLISQKILIGKTEKQVIELLGKPDDKIPEHQCFRYAVETNLRCTALWKCALLIYFDNKTKQVSGVFQAD